MTSIYRTEMYTPLVDL